MKNVLEPPSFTDLLRLLLCRLSLKWMVAFYIVIVIRFMVASRDPAFKDCWFWELNSLPIALQLANLEGYVGDHGSSYGSPCLKASFLMQSCDACCVLVDKYPYHSTGYSKTGEITDTA